MPGTYNPKELALSLGFTEAEADQLAKAEADATNIRRVAVAKGLLSTKPKLGKLDAEPAKAGESVHVSKVVIKKHRHSYRKDGTCRCGAVKGTHVIIAR